MMSKEQKRAYDKVYCARPDIKKRRTAQMRKYREQGKCGATSGVTLDQKREMLHAQGFCAICSCQMTLERHKINSAHIDHDHKTGKVRGLLCVNCNHGIGKFKDNPYFLESAASYLRLCA